MREFTLEQLCPSRQLLNKINKELSAQRKLLKINKYREKAGVSTKLACSICLHNWEKMSKQGKIVELGPRQWLMEWDD